MRAILIGAGRGARLMPTTEDAPKCFAEIQGKRILDWTLEALRGGGCTEIVFIGGWESSTWRPWRSGFITRWQKGPNLRRRLIVSSSSKMPNQHRPILISGAKWATPLLLGLPEKQK